VLLGIDGETTMPPLSPAQAVAQLRSWLQAYEQAWQAPLPVALRTGLAYLQAMQGAAAIVEPDPIRLQEEAEGDESSAEAALRQAQDIFEGGFSTEGEWTRSPYLQRSFESFEDIAPNLPQWANTLYGALITQVQLTRAVEATEPSGEGV
jgi:exodeoxyribonuclease V gamma subunit